jgi:hypothetical protein
MKASTENSSENPLDRVAEKEQVSVYSVNFTQVINNHQADREIVLKPLKAESSEEKNIQPRLSQTIFRRRNTIGIAAILVIGILHFAFQLSVIQTEKKQVAEAPASIEQVREQPAVETKPAAFEATKADIVLPVKTAPQIRQRQPEIAPSKMQLKKKEALDPRAVRLRRAEKILTGI